jgi:hypothetical protein
MIARTCCLLCAALALGLGACGDDSENPNGGASGGRTSTGGSPSTGGAPVSGGASAGGNASGAGGNGDNVDGCPLEYSMPNSASDNTNSYCDPDSTWDLEGVSFSSWTSAEDVAFCDPNVEAHFDPNGYGNVSLPTTVVFLNWNFSSVRSAGGSNNNAELEVYGDRPTSLPVTVPSATGAFGEDLLGKFLFNVRTPTTGCIATSGSVTITRYDDVGGKIEGSYDMTSFMLYRGACCPESLQGSFSVARGPDL